MQIISPRILVYTLLNLCLLIIAIVHLPSIFERPKAPIEVTQDGQKIFIAQIIDKNASGDLMIGDQLTGWNNQSIPILQAVDFLTSFGNIEQDVTINFVRDGHDGITTITLIPYYPSYRYLFIIIFVGFAIWMFSFFILYFGPDNSSSRTLHWCFTALSIAILTSTGTVDNRELWIYITETILFFFYMFTVSGFYFFSTIFPFGEKNKMHLRKALIFIPSNILVSFILYFRLSSIYYISLDDFVTYQSLFAFFHITLFIFIGGAIFNFIYAYRQAELNADRIKIKWIMWGLITGSLPFLLFYILPQILTNFLPDIFSTQEPIREEYTMLFFLVIPFAFTVTIIKYHFIDINFLISRTIGYSILTLFLGAFYITSVLVIISTFEQAVFDEYLIILAVTLIVFLLFNPLRIRIQKFIDELFFPGRRFFRDAVNDISEKLLHTLRSDDLFKELISCLCKYIPVTNIAIYSKAGRKLRIQENFHPVKKKEVQIPVGFENNLSPGIRIFGNSRAIKTHRQTIDTSCETLLMEMGFAVGIPMKNKNNELIAALFASPYNRNTAFIEEEVDLLMTGISVASEMLERLILQEKIILEQADKKRLKELSEIKSHFVSNVSHELKSPLSSIKVFAELLIMNKKVMDKDRIEFANIINGETDRLTRLIDNVLDISKIEHGVKQYHFSDINPNEIIREVIGLMRYQLDQYNFTVQLDLDEKICEMEADRDALIQALANLISNVIKYSGETKYLCIILAQRNQYIEIRVIDKGLGMEEEDLPHIFETFYRGQGKHTRNISGTGIGLGVVHHIVQAHHGKIEVASIPGQGTTFALLFPIQK